MDAGALFWLIVGGLIIFGLVYENLSLELKDKNKIGSYITAIAITIAISVFLYAIFSGNNYSTGNSYVPDDAEYCTGPVCF